MKSLTHKNLFMLHHKTIVALEAPIDNFNTLCNCNLKLKGRKKTAMIKTKREKKEKEEENKINARNSRDVRKSSV
jgi:hypothetical protein